MGRKNRKSVFIAYTLALIILFGTSPWSMVNAKAVSKQPAISKKTTVQVNKKKTIKIQKNGYTIKKIISAKSSAKTVAKVTVKGKKVIVRGKKAGTSRITIKIRAKRKGKVKTFKLKTLLTVKKAGSASDSKTKTESKPETKTDTESKPDTKPEPSSKVDRMIAGMTLDQKISQMIMPSFRRWDPANKNVTDLSELPGLAAALKRHQYGGVILFGQNIIDTAQTARLISHLQKNNAGTGNVPYLVASDQEGGAVNRLSMGTRGTGSMAIGATGDKAPSNARAIGEVFGEEMEALGINVNLGPCVDVITDLEDLGLSTRVYSDDPDTNAKLGMAFAEGVGKSKVITTYKHFPGAGDGSDYPTSIKLSLEELKEGGLKAYRKVIEGGAEMLMTSATTFPEFDDEQVMADGVTKGYYPATISPKIVTELLRKELGFDGVVITDALEMEQFIKEPDTGADLFPGKAYSVAHDVIVAEKCIVAGCDILLLPTDLTGDDAVQYYDDYINGIIGYVEKGEISEERINESVKRILTLKEKHGILDLNVSGDGIDEKIARAKETVGSDAHHAVEIETARQAVTLIKNEDTLPLAGVKTKLVFVGNSKSDGTPIAYAIRKMQEEGMIDPGARIENRISGENSGDEAADTRIIIDCFYKSSGKLVYPDTLTDSIKDADAVVCLSKIIAGIDQLQDTNPVMQGVDRALNEAHSAGAKFVLLSTNLPMDTKRFKDADASLCAYLSAGYGVDPTARTAGTENVGAFNANVPAAICAMFDSPDKMTGTLPIRIPDLERVWRYSTR